MPKRPPKETEFVVCISNAGYEVSLEIHKIYRVLPDDDASIEGDLRVVDESGEDYLFPASCFIPIEVPTDIRKSLLQAS